MNFYKYYNEYENYSLAQKQVAKNLLDYMGKSNIFNTQINSIFEIGCGTGIFTRVTPELYGSETDPNERIFFILI